MKLEKRPLSMRNFLIIFLALFASSTNAQSGIYNGSYEKKYEMSNGDFHHYKITLNPDGTFVYHSHSKISKGIPPETSIYGRGTWRAENNIISLTTDRTKDLDETYTLDLSNTKARYYSKSPRDKSDRIVLTALRFYQSDIFWVKRKELLKSK